MNGWIVLLVVFTYGSGFMDKLRWDRTPGRREWWMFWILSTCLTLLGIGIPVFMGNNVVISIIIAIAVYIAAMLTHELVLKLLFGTFSRDKERKMLRDAEDQVINQSGHGQGSL